MLPLLKFIGKLTCILEFDGLYAYIIYQTNRFLLLYWFFVGAIYDEHIYIVDFNNPEKFNPVSKTW